MQHIDFAVKYLRYLDDFLLRRPVLHEVVAAHAEIESQAVAAFLADILRYHDMETRPVFYGASKPVRAPVRVRREELVEEPAVRGLHRDHIAAAQHSYLGGVAKGVDAELLEGLNAHFNGECAEVGMYLAMSRVADREGYPEVAEAFKRYAFEEAEHACKFAELLGDVLTDSTKKNLQMRAEAENGACAAKKELAVLAKKLNLDAIHDTVHEMCKDEARHGKGFEGLLKRYF